jgi:hypothetical protein
VGEEATPNAARPQIGPDRQRPQQRRGPVALEPDDAADAGRVPMHPEMAQMLRGEVRLGQAICSEQRPDRREVGRPRCG